MGTLVSTNYSLQLRNGSCHRNKTIARSLNRRSLLARNWLHWGNRSSVPTSSSIHLRHYHRRNLWCRFKASQQSARVCPNRMGLRRSSSRFDHPDLHCPLLCYNQESVLGLLGLHTMRLMGGAVWGLCIY